MCVSGAGRALLSTVVYMAEQASQSRSLGSSRAEAVPTAGVQKGRSLGMPRKTWQFRPGFQGLGGQEGRRPHLGPRSPGSHPVLTFQVHNAVSTGASSFRTAVEGSPRWFFELSDMWERAVRTAWVQGNGAGSQGTSPKCVSPGEESQLGGAGGGLEHTSPVRVPVQKLKKQRRAGG